MAFPCVASFLHSAQAPQPTTTTDQTTQQPTTDAPTTKGLITLELHFAIAL